MDEKVYASLARLCSKREYCSSDMRKKALERLQGDRAAAEEMVALLVEERYVDDLRYASAFAREKSALTGWGPAKIRFALAAKGIARGIADEALGQVDDEKAAEMLRRLLESKWKTLKEDPQGKLKLIKFALSRGYDYEDVRLFVDDLT